MNLQKIIFLGIVMVLLSACGGDSTSSPSTQEENLSNSEVTSEEVSQREELSTNEDEIVVEGNIWHVSTVAEFRQALEDASVNGENDKVVLEAGVYNVDSDGLGTFDFNDNEEFNLTIISAEGLNRDDVILNGNNTHQVFNFDNTKNSTLTFKGISIIDGNSSTNGGGIYSNHSIKIEDCNISNNSSSGFGGGFSSNGITIIINSIISNNRNNMNYYSKGGGFYSSDIVTITNSTISNNVNIGKDSYGGGFYSDSNITIINSTISNNSNIAYYYSNGGGFYSLNGNIIITNSTIFNNENNCSGTSSGGGFYSALTTITNSIVSNNKNNNSYYSSGGGFYSSMATITNSTVSNNSNNSNNNRSYGGGFYSDTAIVINSKFFENNSTNGAIYCGWYGNSFVSNNIFINNYGYIEAKGVFINNIFKNNRKMDINLIDSSKIYNNYIDYAKIEDNGFNFIKKNNLQPSEVGDVYLNSDNKTLSRNSPVIDKGLNPNSTTFKEIFDNDDIYNQVVELLNTDIDGKPRVVNGTIDMGASERQ